MTWQSPVPLFVGAVFSRFIFTVLLRDLAVSGSSAARLSPSPYITSGRDIVVGIAIRYGLDTTGIESRRKRDFSHPPDRPWGLPSLLYNGYRIIPGGKMSGEWGWPAASSSAEVKERIQLTFSPLWAFVDCSRVEFLPLFYPLDNLLKLQIHITYVFKHGRSGFRSVVIAKFSTTFRYFMTCSDESGWECVAGESVFAALLPWLKSFSAQSYSVLH